MMRVRNPVSTAVVFSVLSTLIGGGRMVLAVTVLADGSHINIGGDIRNNAAIEVQGGDLNNDDTYGANEPVWFAVTELATDLVGFH